MLLLVIVAAALIVIGRGAGGSWWWICAGLAAFGVTDTVYVYQVAKGMYVDGGVLDLGWMLAIGAFGLAASSRPRTGAARRLDGMSVIAVPGLCALAALGLLFELFLATGNPLAGTLALGAVLAALGRTGLTLREVRALADSRRQARTDELIGLPNRRTVYETLASADLQLAHGQRSAVLPIGLGRFKEINDPLGHAAGDALLRLIGPRLTPELRGSDLLVRLGGDEFKVVAPAPYPGARVASRANGRHVGTRSRWPWTAGPVAL